MTTALCMELLHTVNVVFLFPKYVNDFALPSPVTLIVAEVFFRVLISSRTVTLWSKFNTAFPVYGTLESLPASCPM